MCNCSCENHFKVRESHAKKIKTEYIITSKTERNQVNQCCVEANPFLISSL